MKILTWCYKCQQQISFDNRTRNRNGGAIPVDDYGNLHSCRHKKRKPGFPSQKCFRCGQVIHFDKNYRSISGKYIPLDWNSGKRHDCNETPDLRGQRALAIPRIMKKKCNGARYVPGLQELNHALQRRRNTSLQVHHGRLLWTRVLL